MPSGGAPYAAPTHDVELTGESFSVADIFCATMLANAFYNELLTEDGPLRD